MAKINNSHRVSRCTMGLVAGWLEIADFSSNSANHLNYEQVIQDALRHSLVLQSIYGRGDRLCVLSPDGRVTPFNLGDVCPNSHFNVWGAWMAEGHYYPDVPTIRVVQHGLPAKGVYLIVYELFHFGDQVNSPRFEDALYFGVQDLDAVANMSYGNGCVAVISRPDLTPEEAARMVDDCLKEIQAILVLEPDNHHDVVRLQATDFANPDEAIGFLDPDWNVDDLLEAVQEERI